MRFARRVLLFSACSVSGLAAQDPVAPPNVVLILVDDLGWTDLSCQGSRYYETPNIDRLASQGVRFTDAYAACAVCSPTRAAVMTGRYPARVGVTDWIRARFQRGGIGTPERNPTERVGGRHSRLLCPPNPYWMEHAEVTIAELLAGMGYATAHIGKWHLGDEDWYPGRQGFAENHGGCDYGQPPSYFDPYRNDKLAQGIPTLPPRKEGEYLTDREADEAAGFIRRNRDRPFFLHLAPYAVHTPIQAKPALTERYRAKAKTKQKNARYAAMIHSLDEAVGTVLGALEANELVDRTLVVFTSDNGGLLGPTHNAPLRSGKGFPYEGGIRVPLIVRWPGLARAGAVSHAPVSSIDLLPTILAAVGAATPEGLELDGVPLVEHLRSGEAIDRDHLLWHFPHYRGRLGPYSILRAGDWKLIKRYEGPKLELYNLAEDLGEQHDVAAKHPQRVAELDATLSARLAAMGAKLPVANPDYVPRKRVLLLGDSISIGYTPHVRRRLAGADVFRPTNEAGGAENCAGTTKGVQRIDDWLAIDGGGFDVIHFNFGLHDLKRVHPETGKNSMDPGHPRQAEPEIYERQLREIVGKLRKTGAELIFATTTPVPEGVRPRRDIGDPERYNAIAKRIMREAGIAIDDLYAFASPRLSELQKPNDVHFAPRGQRALGEQVAEHVRRALRAREK